MAEILLHGGHVAVIDDDDLPLVAGYKWCAHESSNNKRYVVTHTYSEDGARTAIYLHRMLLSAPKGVQVDHINRDGLDNRRANLRLCTHNENQHNRSKQANNTSGYKGVSWCKRNKRWGARIVVDGASYRLGLFDTPEEAHAAYCRAAAFLHGEFARSV